MSFSTNNLAEEVESIGKSLQSVELALGEFEEKVQNYGDAENGELLEIQNTLLLHVQRCNEATRELLKIASTPSKSPSQASLQSEPSEKAAMTEERAITIDGYENVLVELERKENAEDLLTAEQKRKYESERTAMVEKFRTMSREVQFLKNQLMAERERIENAQKRQETLNCKCKGKLNKEVSSKRSSKKISTTDDDVIEDGSRAISEEIKNGGEENQASAAETEKSRELSTANDHL